MKKIRVAAVSYLNAKPLLYGIKKHPVIEQIDLIEDYPSKIADLLINDKVDLALIPVAAIHSLSHPHIISDYCIGSNGAVASVCMFSDVPLDDIEHVYLDYQSKTSVNLVKILFKEFWKKNVFFIDAKGEEFINEIKGTTAGVVIGDRALEQAGKSQFIYDLGKAWKQHTNLPFVFAAWVANKVLPNTFISQFNEANLHGVDNIDFVVSENNSYPFDLKYYFKNNISYELDEAKRKGMNLFLKKMKEL